MGRGRVTGHKIGDAMKRLGLLALSLLAAACGTEADPPDSAAASPTVLPLPLTVVSTEDISYPGTTRKVSRVALDVDQIPTGQQLRSSAVAVWSDQGRGVDEFTAFLYLPEMDHQGAAYAVGEFTPVGITSLKIQEASLYGHPWYGQTDMARSTATAEADFERRRATATKRDYTASIEAELSARGVLDVRVATDFPDGTILDVGVGRTHWVRGSDEAYSGELHGADLAVENGAVSFTTQLDDARWIREHEELVEIDVVAPIERISDEIEISVLYTPMNEQPASVVAVLGEAGENVAGEGADDTMGFVVYRVEKSLAFPMKR